MQRTLQHLVLLSLPPALATFFPAVLMAAEPPRAEFGFEQRVRNENWNNVFDYSDATDDERRQIRYRTRVWARVPLTPAVILNLGLNSETNQILGSKTVMDEVVFDIANIEVPQLVAPGLSLKVGRQDLFRGEGLILAEGTPWDGSRTTYFNAVNLTYRWNKSALEALAISAPKYDRRLPRFRDQHRLLQDRDEQAFGLYFTDRTLARTTVESYLIRKREVRHRLPEGNPQHQADRRVDTLGIRATRSFNDQWTGTAEAARQWGVEAPSRRISAWATYAYLKHTWTSRSLRPFVTVGAWALSGDDPGRPGIVGAWEPLFGRYPRWGDLELYSQLPEHGVGYATNQKRLQVESGFTPRRNLGFKLSYARVTAFHPYDRNPKVFGSGLNRGHNFQARADFRLNSFTRGHVDWETLLPGDFYAKRDRSYFLRFELSVEYKRAINEFWRGLTH